MNAVQVHRGPDDEGVYEDPVRRLALGARRLSIIDVAGGHQPLCNEDGTIWAILNGEIYNSPALQARLRSQGHRFKSHADTETLVHLYEEYGDELVHAIEGMFAFAVWDESRGRLLLGRDRFGQKPVFLSRQSGNLIFASETSALVRPLEFRPELDLDAVDLFMVLGYVPGPGTILQGIEQLPPGSILTWDHASNAVETRAYWAPSRSAQATAEPDDEVAAETLRLLEQAVRETLVADVPVGLFLSGGVDSTLLTALTHSLTDEPAQTFTVGYDIGAVSEVREARLTAEQLGTIHHELIVDGPDIASRVPRVLGALDQPLADPAIIPLHAVSELARRHVTVVIGGEGADELFGGYPRYRWLIRATQLGRIVPPRYAALAARAITFASPGQRTRRLADIIGPQTTLERHLDWVTANRRHARPALYGPRLEAHAGSENALSTLSAHLNGGRNTLDAGSFMHLDQRQWLPDDVLYKVDRAGMLNSLEVRAPYLQTALAEFANSVTVATHLSGSGKKLLREALSTRYPAVAAHRPKTAFRVPGAQWLRGPLQSLLVHQLNDGSLVREGFIDRATLQTLIREHCAGEDRTALLWPVLSLGLWLDRYLALDA
jgi:asparagine synthase (glutamine-hydrolysing)